MNSIGTINSWRLESPGNAGWARSADPTASDKYFVVNTDSHANEPTDVFHARLPVRYHDRLPHVEVDDKGNQWLHIEGWRPQLVKPAALSTSEDAPESAALDSGNVWTDELEPDDLHRMEVASSKMPETSGLAVRRRDAQLDGINAELVFPGRGLLAFATPDVEFSGLMARAWNRWALEVYAGHMDRFAPIPMVAPMELDAAIEEIGFLKEQGFRGVLLPCRPVAGDVQDRKQQYNSRHFDSLWAAIEDAALPVMFHVATGRDPRAASGDGGAVINLVMNSLSQVIEPLATVLASGVLERHPRLVLGTVEGGVGWLPWLLSAMDMATRKHHMWARPKMAEPPSFYYRRQCFSTFIEEDPKLLCLLEEMGLADNIMWSNDYPHQEGSWPHSKQAIERQLVHVSEATRSKALGLNAARVFGFNVAD